MLKFKIIILIFFTFIISSCNVKEKKGDINKIKDSSITNSEVIHDKLNNFIDSYFSDDNLSFLDEPYPLNKDYLLKTDKLNDSVTNMNRALRSGVLCTEILYLYSFQKNNTIIEYITAFRRNNKLLDNGFYWGKLHDEKSKKIFDIEKWLPDRFKKMNEKMFRKNQQEITAYICYGIVIEKLYLYSRISTDYNPDFVQKILKHRKYLIKLSEIFTKINKKEQTLQFIDNINKIESDIAKVNRIETEDFNKINKDKFENLFLTISEIRNSIIEFNLNTNK